MLNKIKNMLRWRPVELSEVKAPHSGNAAFILSIHNIEVGKLTLQDGVWTFEYSDYFKNQQNLKPLVNFPDKTKKYEYHHLPPFFASRIPGLGQPVVKDFLHKEGLEEANEVILLKKFGKRTIANPYLLEMA